MQQMAKRSMRLLLWSAFFCLPLLYASAKEEQEDLVVEDEEEDRALGEFVVASVNF